MARLDMSDYFKRNKVIALDMVKPNWTGLLQYLEDINHISCMKKSNHFYLIRFALGEES